MDFRDPALIPLPTTDDEFERLCLLIARDRYGPEFYTVRDASHVFLTSF